MKTQRSKLIQAGGLLLALGVTALVLTVAPGHAASPEGRGLDIARQGVELSLRWLGITNASYEAQARTNLVQGDWGFLDTVIGVDGITVYPVPPDNSPSRFFRVLFPRPTVTAGEPAFVPEAGGATVYITGQYFYEGDQISVGGVLLGNVTFLSSTLLSGLLPTLAPGLHDIEVIGGQSGAVLAVLPGALEVSPPLERVLQGPPEWPPAGPVANGFHFGHGIIVVPSDKVVVQRLARGHVTVLKSQEDGHVTVLKSRDDGHVTVLKSRDDGGIDEDLNDIADIRLFSGEVRQQVTDLAVPGRGLDFVWTRTYRSRTGVATPQGNRWSHSYDVRCAQNGGAIDVYDGTGRKDAFRLQSNGTYTCPEFFREGTLDPATDAFRLTFADTGYWEFNPPDTSAAAGKLARIVDRNGNTMTLGYDATGRLERVVDDLGRTNTVAYNPVGQLMSVTDFSGRTVRYEYDGMSNLTACVSPAVTGTSNGNDFPGGKTNRYVYSSGYADDRENHLLLSVIDGRGQTSHRYVYQHNQTDADFLRCISLQRGTHQPTRITYVPQAPTPANRFAALRCIVNDPVGNVIEASYDVRNRCVALREYTGRATPGQPVTDVSNRPSVKLRADDPDFFESIWSWDNDSLCTAWQKPLTNRIEWVYQGHLDPATPPRQRGNLREERRLAIGDLDGDGQLDVVVTRFEHDPRFGADPTGPSVDAIVPVQPRHAVNTKGTGAQIGRLIRGGVCDEGNGLDNDCDGFITRAIDPRGFETRCDYDEHGNLVRAVSYGGQVGIGHPQLDFGYNPQGQLTAITNAADGEGRRRVDTFSYHGASPQRGYLQQAVMDAGAVGSNLTTSYEYDARGNVTRVTDPRGTPTDFEVNALDQTVARQTQGALLSERIHSEFWYDAANNLVRRDVENRDGEGTLNPTNAAFTTLYEYDVLRRLTRLMEEEGIYYSVLTNEFVYDGNDRLVLTRSPAAVHGVDPAAVTRFAYDERGLLFQTERAPGTGQDALEQLDYDANGNRRRVSKIDAITIKQTVFEHDGLDRCVRVTDAMGNETRYEYDLHGNVTRATEYGETNDVPGSAGNRRLAETRYEYDGLDRLVQFRPAFFDVFTEVPIGDGFQDNTLAYAPNGLVVASTNDRGHGTTYTYDTMFFLAAVADAGSNRVEYAYDANGNVLSVTEAGHSDLGGPDEVFVRAARYDALDRLVADWDNVGNTNRYLYDSRGNLVRHIDPLGFALEGDFDSISRPTSNRKGVGGSAQRSTRYVWDAASRLVSLTDGNTNTTQYAYDSLDRLVRATLADGTTVTNVYDGHGNLAWTRDANGTQITFDYDALNRCTQKSIAPGPGVAADTTVETYQYDGLSRLVRAANNHTEVIRAYDSLGRCVREGTASPVLGFNPREYTRTFDAHGLALAQTYPSGRVAEYSYDALDRPIAFSTRASAGMPAETLGDLRYSAPSDSRLTSANGIQSVYTYGGLVGATNPPGDFGWGQIRRVRHTAGGGAGPVVDERTFAYDRNQNKTLRALTEPFMPGGPTNWQEFAYNSLECIVASVQTTPPAMARTTEYVLDPMGNRLSVIRDGVTNAYTLNPTLPVPGDFQVHQYTVTPFDERQYDENGNLHQTMGGGPLGPETRTLSFDYADRLVAVQDLTGLVARYTYDALGRRIAKVRYAGLPPVPSVTNRYLYADGQVIEEEDGGGVVQRTHVVPHVLDHQGRAGEYFVLDGTRSQDDGVIRGGRVTIDGEGHVTYALCDDQGSALAVTDAKGQVLERYDYDDYGLPRFLTSEGLPATGSDGLPLRASPSGNPRLFHGMEWDDETGLYQTQARGGRKDMLQWVHDFLDPNTGSTLSRTYAFPHVFDQKGRAYADNNPHTLKKEEGGRHTPFHNRISMNVTVPKQTQGATFGEKVNAGLHAAGGALAQGAVRAKGTVKFFNDAKGFGRTGGGGTKAQDHNSSRSNKTASRVDFGGGGGGAGKANSVFQFSGPGSDPFTGRPAALIVPVAINKGLRLAYYETKHDTAKNSIGNIR